MATLLHTKKPKRAEAFKLVRKLYEGGELTDGQKCSLLNYFLPNIEKGKPKNLFSWLSLAAAKSDYRRALTFVSSVGGLIYASNGHCLHWATAPEWAGTEQAFWQPSALEHPLRVDFDDKPISFTEVIKGNEPTRWHAYNPALDHHLTSEANVALVQLPGMGSNMAVTREYWAIATSGLTNIYYGATDRAIRGYGTLHGVQANFIIMGHRV